MFKLYLGEKLKLLEERDQEKEKTTAHVGKADRVMAEVEELKGKMKSIELEKTSLQATVSKNQKKKLLLIGSCLNEL